MPKINYNRRKQWIIKTPVTKPNKVIQPDSIYNRTKQKKNENTLIERGLAEYEDIRE